MLYRSAVIGMLFTTMSLVAVQVHRGSSATVTVKPHAARTHRSCARVSPHLDLATATATDVITVSPATSAAMVTQFIKLSLDEHVHSIDGLVVEGWPAAAISERVRAAADELSPRKQVMTLVVDGAAHERRIVIEQTYGPLLFSVQG